MNDTTKRKLNNTGSTLVMVIVIALFVGIIAALVLALTMRNFESAKLKKSSEGNFYSAENVVDEIKTRLEHYADQAAKTAYTMWLEQYSYMNNAEERKTLFLSVYEDTLKQLIKDNFLEGGEYYYLDRFGDVTTSDGAKVKWNTEVTPSIRSEGKNDADEEISEYDGQVIIDGISITFTGADKLSTSITTNLKLTMEYPDLKVFAASNDFIASKFVIIADGDIRNSLSGSNISITGNLYSGGEDVDVSTEAGKGICFSGMAGTETEIKIHADKIITRESFLVSNSAIVKVEGKQGESLTHIDPFYVASNLWAKDIVLMETVKSSGATLDFKGNAYIADDLSLNAEKANFKLYGEYYGYSVNNAKSYDTDRNGTPEGSSAIVINGADSTLDLEHTDKIWISGKAFISIGENANFLEGESLTYRALQAAYLLPG
jgi:hypothetical protein